MTIYLTRHVKKNSIKNLCLPHHELIGRTEEDKGKKYLIVDYYMLHKVLDKIKEIIGIKQFDNIKIFIDTDGKLPDDITLKNIVILIIFVIKDDNNYS